MRCSLSSLHCWPTLWGSISLFVRGSASCLFVQWSHCLFFNDFLKWLSMCTCVHACVKRMHIPEEGFGFLCEPFLEMLGTKLRSSARAVHALHCWGLSSSFVSFHGCISVFASVLLTLLQRLLLTVFLTFYTFCCSCECNLCSFSFSRWILLANRKAADLCVGFVSCHLPGLPCRLWHCQMVCYFLVRKPCQMSLSILAPSIWLAAF